MGTARPAVLAFPATLCCRDKIDIGSCARQREKLQCAFLAAQLVETEALCVYIHWQGLRRANERRRGEVVAAVVRHASSMRATVFMVSTSITISRFTSPISPTTSGPWWSAPRSCGASRTPRDSVHSKWVHKVFRPFQKSRSFPIRSNNSHLWRLGVSAAWSPICARHHVSQTKTP
jgi:hypothetical protein